MDATTEEAVELLKRLRVLAGVRVRRPTLRILKPRDRVLCVWMASQAVRAASEALSLTRYSRGCNRAGWVASIDRAIATLEASDG